MEYVCRYFSEAENHTGFMGHFCGALAGLLVGIFVLENRRVRVTIFIFIFLLPGTTL
jgi:hypothetical protein